MAEYSRVKKYEQLRKEIETDQKGRASDESLGFTQNLNNQSKENDYTPTHEKNFKQEENNTSSHNTASFKNEYLDSFIQEVRDYNIQKGIRESEDTKLDILQQLTSKNREKRANYIERIEEEQPNMKETFNADKIDTNLRNEETLEISRQVFDLLNETENTKDDVNQTAVVIEDEVEETVQETENIPEVSQTSKSLDERIASLEQELGENQIEDVVPTLKEEDEEELSAITKQELLEQTMQLKVKMEQYEDELSEINSGVDSNNRLLNIVISVLIVALLCVIGVVVYWLISGGIL